MSEKLSLEELNELMASKVMGWLKHHHLGTDMWFSDEQPMGTAEDYKPSTDWKYAGMVVDTLLVEYQYLHFRLYSRDNGFEANFINRNDGRSFSVGTADEAPEAICIAALRLINEGEK
jgi:hypothetical protein